jgi:hypothetical protein
VEVFPSPKFQLHCEIVLLPVERSVNAVGLLKQTILSLKLALGSGFTVTGIAIVSLHIPAPAIKVTVYVPAVVYVFSGFCVVEVFPSPNVQFQEAGGPVERSVKCVLAPMQTGPELKFATGGMLESGTFTLAVSIHPFESVTVSV